MPEETPTEGAQAGQGGAATPSQQETPSQDLVSKAELEQTVATLQNTIKELGERLKQSQRDAVRDRTQQIGSRIAESLLERLGPKLQDAGIDLEKEKREAWIDLQMQQSLASEGGKEPSPQAGSAQDSDATGSPRDAKDVLVSSILDEHGLSKDDPEIRDYLARTPAGTPISKIAVDLAQLSQQVAQRKQAGVAGGIGIQAGAPSGAPSQEELAKEYVQEAAKLRGKGMHALRKLQQRMREKGLENPETISLDNWKPYSERKLSLSR